MRKKIDTKTDDADEKLNDVKDEQNNDGTKNQSPGVSETDEVFDPDSVLIKCNSDFKFCSDHLNAFKYEKGKTYRFDADSGSVIVRDKQGKIVENGPVSKPSPVDKR